MSDGPVRVLLYIEASHHDDAALAAEAWYERVRKTFFDVDGDPVPLVEYDRYTYVASGHVTGRIYTRDIHMSDHKPWSEIRRKHHCSAVEGCVVDEDGNHSLADAIWRDHELNRTTEFQFFDLPASTRRSTDDHP